MSELRVHVRHMRAIKLCARGVREWFATQGFDWSDFVSHGIPASKLIATGDAFALRAVAAAEEEAERGH